MADTITCDITDGKVIRYTVYRKPGLWTPYEQQKAYMDESPFECDETTVGIVEQTRDLSNGDILLGIRYMYDDWVEGVGAVLVKTDHKEFRRLSDLAIQSFDGDSELPIWTAEEVRDAHAKEYGYDRDC